MYHHPLFGLSTVDRFLRGMAVGRAVLAGEMRGVLHTPAENHIQIAGFCWMFIPTEKKGGFHKWGWGYPNSWMVYCFFHGKSIFTDG
jgi:hypothetical protein